MTEYDLLDPQVFSAVTALMFIIVVFRYVIISGAFYVLFYLIAPNKLNHRKIFSGPSRSGQYIKEFLWSVFTSLLFALAGTGMLLLWQSGFTQVYDDINEYPLWWVPLSFLMAAFIHETYYYWLHRWMHKPPVYKLIHKIHHDSHITSPWTSFSFHPGEGVLQALAIPVIILFLPMHYWTIVGLLIFMTLTSAINHSNVEIYPNGFHKHWLGKWFIGATHHNLHHTHYKRNFGLYFTFWDKLMKTESEDYISNFEKHTK